MSRRIARLLRLAVSGALSASIALAAAPPPAFPQVAAPQWVSGADGGGKVQLVWIRNPAFASVRVQRRDDISAETFRQIGQTKENVWLDETVQSGGIYGYRLVGVAPDGRESRPSAELVVRIATATRLPPVAPTWEGYLPSEGGVQLRWAARPGEDVLAWNVYRRTPPETEYRLIGSSRSTSYRDVGLEPGRQYVYVLTALDSNFGETPFSSELTVMVKAAPARVERQAPPAWVVRRTRLISIVSGGKNLPFERPADVVVGPLTRSVYVADSGRNVVFVFTSEGVHVNTITPGEALGGVARNVLGLATDREETLYVVDAGAGEVLAFPPKGGPGRRVSSPRRAGEVTGLIDAAIAPGGNVLMVDNYNNRVAVVGSEGGGGGFGQAGAKGGEFSAPTFCDVDAAGSFYVSDCLNSRVQVFDAAGKFVRAFGRAERGPGGFGRPKGIAVGPGGEVYVADSWLNTIQVFDGEGRFKAILGDESGRPLDLGSPNGIALGPGNRILVAERLAARLQIRELIDVP